MSVAYGPLPQINLHTCLCTGDDFEACSWSGRSTIQHAAECSR